MRVPSRSVPVGIARTAAVALAAGLSALPGSAAAHTGHRHHRHHAHHRGHAARHRHHRGHAAGHTLRVSDHAHLHLSSADGNTLIEKGRAYGNLPGTVKVTLTLRSSSATSSFTLYVKGGSITGHGQGHLKTGAHGYDSFGGRLIVGHGGGRYRGVHGSGGIYGSVYRVTDAMSVKVKGTLHY